LTLYVGLITLLERIFKYQIMILPDKWFVVYNIFYMFSNFKRRFVPLSEGISHANKLLHANLIIITNNSFKSPKKIDISRSFKAYLIFNHQDKLIFFSLRKFYAMYSDLIGQNHDYILMLNYIHNDNIKYRSIKSLAYKESPIIKL